jgi:surface antigen
VRRWRRRLLHAISERRVVRYGLLSLNLALLAGVVAFVLQTNPTTSSAHHNAAISKADTAGPSDPLDQLSSADIAVNTARMIGLAEEPAVKNQADSVSAELATPPVYTAVISKPQAVATDLKSLKDIQNYVVQAGDTVSSIATKFNVTSDSIKWSNSLSTDAVNTGTNLTIPPVNGIVYDVKAGDTPDTLAQRFRATKEQIIAYNDAEIAGLKVGQKIIIPNGQVVAPARSSYAYGGGFAWGSSAVYGYNGYVPGYCTWYVANQRIKIGRPLPANLGNAYTWDDNAIRAGFTVNRSPERGAAVITDTYRNPGHVAYVEEVNADGSVKISEMNKNWVLYQITSRTMSPSEAASYNYIH